MMDSDFILQLYQRPETVFTIDAIAQLFPHVSYESIRDRLYYSTKAGKLLRLRQGMYAKHDYNPFELANKLYTPSYISLETVLGREGVVFQYYTTVFAVSYLTRTVMVGGAEIQYRRIRGDILTNTQGVEEKIGYFLASRERAFLDAVYIYKNYHFDHLGLIDWEKVEEMKTIYKSHAFQQRVGQYYKIYKKDYGHH